MLFSVSVFRALRQIRYNTPKNSKSSKNAEGPIWSRLSITSIGLVGQVHRTYPKDIKVKIKKRSNNSK